MAKKAKRQTYTPDVTPGADPNGGNALLSRRMGNIMGCACLLVFIMFKELWIGMLAFGIGFAIIYGLEVLVEKSGKWYTSSNLYLSLGSLALAYAEYAYQLLTNLMSFGK